MNGRDWPRPKQGGHLSEWERGQTYLPEKMKHELVDLPGLQVVHPPFLLSIHARSNVTKLDASKGCSKQQLLPV